MNESTSGPEHIAHEMFREAAPALTKVMLEYLDRQQVCQQTQSEEDEKAVDTMIQIWTETGDYFIQRVRAEFPGIRDQQDIELLIEETREPPEE